jgi:AraC-like DNA-binding protein
MLQQCAGSFHFSTADIPIHERNRAVGELRERGILPIDLLKGVPVSLQVSKHFLPGAGILTGTMCGLRQRATTAAVEELFLGINVAGSSIALQRDREITFGDGDGMLMGCASVGFAVVRPTPVRFLGLRVPRQAIEPLVRDVGGRTMQRIPGNSPALRLLSGYLLVVTEVQGSVSPETSRLAASHLHDLIALSVGATRDGAAAAERGVRAARLRAIKSDISSRLSEETLTVSDVAARHGVTPRYVHKLFEDAETTFCHFILRQRLESAYRMLRDQRLRERSITSIACDCGFGDLSYFNRTFRRRYGGTPSDIRSSLDERPTSDRAEQILE